MSDRRELVRRAREMLERLPTPTLVGHHGDPIDRRRFLTTGGALSAALLAACNSYGPRSAIKLLRYVERRNESVERALLRQGSRDHASPTARDAGRAFPVYYIANTIPIWDARTQGPWALEMSGEVANPTRFTLDDLMRLPRTTQRVDHFCVEGWDAVASWTGVRMRDLVPIVRPLATAKYVDFRSFDSDYHESWDIESALHPQTLVAYGMDGAMLGPAHGAPARVHSPVKLGYKNTKYLTKIVFMSARNGGYWSDQGYEWYGGT